LSLSALAGASLIALLLINYIEQQKKIAAQKILKPLYCVNELLLEHIVENPDVDLEKLSPDIELSCKRLLR